MHEKKLLRIEFATISNYFNCKMIGPICQTSSSLKFISSRHQGVDLITTGMKIFIEEVKGNPRHSQGRTTEAETPG